MKLSEIATYVEEKISSKHISLYQYVTTDSFLQNKQGRTIAHNLPPITCNLIHYRKNDILVSNIRPYLKKVWLADSDGGCSADVLVFRVKNGHSPFFLYSILLLNNFYDYAMQGVKGSKMPRGDKDQIMRYTIPTFSKNQEENIGRLMIDICNKIELNRALNQNLEALAKQLYDYWFVQFDFPDENGRPYKSSGGKMVWNEKLKREIPKGWDVKQIKDVTEVLLGGTPNTSIANYWDGNIPWLNSGEVAEFPILASEKSITEEGKSKSATAFAPKGSVTLSITRHLRPSILAIDACINQSVVAIKEQKGLNKSYLYPYISAEIPRLMSLRTGAQQPHINKEIVEDSLIVIATSDIMCQYFARANTLYESIVANAKEIQSLLNQRDVLLPLLMNGQVSVMPTAVNSDLAHD